MMTDQTLSPSDAPKAGPVSTWIAPPRFALPTLIALGIAADILLWASDPGLGLVLLAVLVAGAMLVLVKPDLTTPGARVALPLFGLSLPPALEFIQPMSVLILMLGLATLALWSVTGRIVSVFSAAAFAVAGPIIAIRDIPISARNTSLPTGFAARIGHLARSLLVPVGLGAVFIALLAGANPVLQSWLQGGPGYMFPEIDGTRVLFWLGTSLLIWPYIAPKSPGHLAVARRQGESPPRDVRPNALLTPTSVMTSLVLFNVIFALQNLLDAQYLWFHRALPDGMTYSQYAHRGANALVVTALLAGGFAMVIRRLSERPVLRLLLGLWLLQTLVVMVSALMRLDLYVDAYGLTRLRLTALFGMGLTAAGLGLIGWQIWRRKSNAWLLRMIGAVTGGALYGLCFFNVAGLIATQNLARSFQSPDLFDKQYVCTVLGQEAHAAILRFEAETGIKRCYLGQNAGPHITGWRDWSFRHARMEREITALSGQ